MTTAAAPSTAHVTAWDRAVIIALGGAGCALSYDALQQMAVAIHVRGFLTYLFPLVIDGFIAYGVRALLVLRDAPLRARMYVWLLFGTATVASIWANELHAVRLNEQSTSLTGLRLGDTVVAILSTLAPLALAGAVHLYILIARRPVGESDRGDLGQPGHSSQAGQVTQVERMSVTPTDRPGQHQPQPGQVTSGQPVTALTEAHKVSPDKQRPDTRAVSEEGRREATAGQHPADSGHADPLTQAADLGGQPVSTPVDSNRSVNPEPVTAPVASTRPVTDRPVTAPPVSDRDNRTTGDRRGDLDTERLLEIARLAVSAEDKLTRKVVAQAIRGQQIPLSSDTLTALMAQLREQSAAPVTVPRN
ncbi:DUF2637 domain-containing protein [Kitasatospora sp. NPDC052896]|uniref:DUF2637 domain-containing protein n=1 Tax=Kitasatospora sp. NPDC052896 TaxID=3364061 RepID=UPI0037C69468